MYGRSNSSRSAHHTSRIRFMRCVTDADGAAVSCDRAWDAFTGIDAARLRNDGWDLVVHPDDRPRFDDVRRESARTLLPFDVDLRIRRADGQFRWCQLSGEIVRAGDNAAGDLPRWILRIVDIHRHKVAQAGLEQALRSRDESLASFAHDLRNPVQTMRHALFALQLEGASAESRPQMLSVLERQIELITRQTHEYLQRLEDARAGEPWMRTPAPQSAATPD